MFRPNPQHANRVLLASEDAEARRVMGDVARAAGLRSVGFIRETDQLARRTELSMPDVLLIDTAMVARAQAVKVSFTSLRDAGPVKIVLCGHVLSAKSGAVSAQQGFCGTLDLAVSGGNVETLGSMLEALLQAEAVAAPRAVAATPPMAVPPRVSGQPRTTLRPDALVIGSSTGGPVALRSVVTALPANFPLPVAIVQHMPPGFTTMLSQRLNDESPLRVLEAQDGMAFTAGTVFIAPGGFHMVLSGKPGDCKVQLNQHAPENSCRPAVDVLFRSAAEVYGGHQLVTVLTGMGRDGLVGATQLHALKARIVVQDAATSTVWGMPGAIAQAGLADDILPLQHIAPHLMRCL